MATLGLIEYADASPEVRAVYDDIMTTRKTDWINNFWKALANDPATLKRTWEDIKQIMVWRARSTHEGTDLRCGQCNQPVWILHRFTHGRRPQEGHDRRYVPRVDGRSRHGE